MNSQQEALISRVRMEKDPFVKIDLLKSVLEKINLQE